MLLSAISRNVVTITGMTPGTEDLRVFACVGRDCPWSEDGLACEEDGRRARVNNQWWSRPAAGGAQGSEVSPADRLRVAV